MQLTFNELNEKGKRKEIDIKIRDQKRIIDLNGVKVEVRFKIDFFVDAQVFYEGDIYCPHIEIQSINEKEPNVLTETGYRSCFFDFWIVEESKSFEEMVERILKRDLEWEWKDNNTRSRMKERGIKVKPELKITW